MNRTDSPVLIAAGGTGGHIFPALAVATVLRDRGIPVVWVGTRAGLESRLVPESGIEIDWLTIGGVRGKGLTALLTAPWKLLHACSQAAGILRRRRPRAVLGMGGFVAGPSSLMAWVGRIPLVVHEQNAIAGLTNRLLARLARRVCSAVPHTFPMRVAEHHTGNPVRSALCAVPDPGQRMGDRTGAVRVLVIGGSQGAKALNEIVPAALGQMRTPFEVWHQAGAKHLESTRLAYAGVGQVRVEAFVDDMAGAYAWTDLVVCRAGAMTVAELAAVGVGAVLVPFPHAVDDHQTANGRYLADAGAAMLVPQSMLDETRLAELLDELCGDRSRLLQMAEIARGLARPDAANEVADAILEVAR